MGKGECPILLIGDRNTKRAQYFLKAAQQLQIPVHILEWNRVGSRCAIEKLKGAVVKIDPPSYKTAKLQDMKGILQEYYMSLKNLSNGDCTFMNSPDAIWQVLNKQNCKARLQEQGVPVTCMITETVESAEELLTILKEKKIYSVFVKPTYFSGAAGVIALRIHPRNQKMMAYTSCILKDKQLINTKVLRCIEDSNEILRLLNRVIELGVMVERWYPKAQFHGRSYDLRVVYQFGHIAYIVVRQAKGPITNLHLNNQALDIRELGINGELLSSIEEMCGQAVDLFPGLSMAGIDILVEKNSQKPYIIEMNGQGDLIYQDIYRNNRIYTEQILQLTQQHH